MIIKKIFTPLIAVSLLTPSLSAAQENSITNQILDSSFFAKSKLDISTRNQWKYLKEDEGTGKNVHAAWGQGITLDFRSGYFADIIGFDASYYGAIALGASDYFDTRGILYNNRSHPGFNKDNATGFSKLSQRYVKATFGDKSLGGNLYYGWKTLRRFGALTTSTRLAPNTYLGLSGDINKDDLVLRAAYVTSAINRNAEQKVNFQTDDKRDINYIMTGEISYKWQDFKVNYFYGESNNYLRRHGLEMDYKLNSEWKFASQIYGTEALSEWKNMAIKNKTFDNSAWHYVVNAKWNDGTWGSVLGLAYSRAPSSTRLGYYPRHISRNSRGTFNALTSTGSDYTRDGEKTLFVGADYQFTEDLNIGFMINYGQFDYKGNNVQTGELNFISRWVPQNERLKGLSVFVLFGPGIGYKTGQYEREPKFVDNKLQRAHTLGAEIVVDYKINLF